jgi:dTDP-4-dehydrorhamnose reductase
MNIDKNTRVFVAGCGGMLGEAFYEKFAPLVELKATDIDVNEPWLSYGDVRDFHGISQMIRCFRPDVIVNLAAITDMESCEKDSHNAWRTNALGAENLALIAAEIDAVYVYICTAGIFDGRQEYFNDFEQPNPLSVYAKSKYHGELFTRERVPRHYVVRAGWMMGGGPRKDKKFINKIYQQIVAGHRTLNVVNDKAGTPTYTKDFACGILKLLESNLYGVYNQVCEGSATRYDVALEFVRQLGLQSEVTINEVSSEYFRGEYFAPRPASEKLINMKLEARGLNVMRDWRQCLEEYCEVFLRHLNEVGFLEPMRKKHSPPEAVPLGITLSVAQLSQSSVKRRAGVSRR